MDPALVSAWTHHPAPCSSEGAVDRDLPARVPADLGGQRTSDDGPAAAQHRSAGEALVRALARRRPTSPDIVDEILKRSDGVCLPTLLERDQGSCSRRRPRRARRPSATGGAELAVQ